MKRGKNLEFLRWIVSGAILGAAIFGVFFQGASFESVGVDHSAIGAVSGGIATAVFVKLVHLV